MKNQIIERFNLTRRDSPKELYDGHGHSPFSADLPASEGWEEEHSWGNGFRSVYVNIHERLVFTYVEGDYNLLVCNSSVEFYKELFEASQFYKEN
jgi:hypothetical protein